MQKLRALLCLKSMQCIVSFRIRLIQPVWFSRGLLRPCQHFTTLSWRVPLRRTGISDHCQSMPDLIVRWRQDADTRNRLGAVSKLPNICTAGIVTALTQLTSCTASQASNPITTAWLSNRPTTVLKGWVDGGDRTYRTHPTCLAEW